MRSLSPPRGTRFATVLAAMAFLLPVFVVTSPVAAQETSFDFRIGAQDEPKTRNILSAGDVWTVDVLNPVYAPGTLLDDPVSGVTYAYIAKGTDTDCDGWFDTPRYGWSGADSGRDEYNKFEYTDGADGACETAVPQRESTLHASHKGEVRTYNMPQGVLATEVFYDFCKVLDSNNRCQQFITFHDGAEVNVDDLLFSIHMGCAAAANFACSYLKQDQGKPGSDFPQSRWLWAIPESGGFYPGDPEAWCSRVDLSVGCDQVRENGKHVKIHFDQTGPYAQFLRITINQGLLPRHIWEGTGGGRHESFGCALNPVTWNGVPQAGVDIPASNPGAPAGCEGPGRLSSYEFQKAQRWDMKDDDVIGAGPFEFVTWTPGQYSQLRRFENFYTGDETLTPITHRLPKITTITYIVYRNTQAAVFALQKGEIDFIAWSVPPNFVRSLQADPKVAIISTKEMGWFYLAYNMRMEPFGYKNNNPAEGDTGLAFRQAVSHLIDKRTIITSLLEGYGDQGVGPVAPANQVYFNSALQPHLYNPDRARAILDAAYGSWSGGLCEENGNGCRDLPTIHRGLIRILTPNADYDPIRATVGGMIASEMRKVGINAKVEYLNFGTIVQRIGSLDFQMFILGWRIGGIVPDHIYFFYHSAALIELGGQNYAGYRNPEMDSVVDEALATSDETIAVERYKHAQYLVWRDLPNDVLYYRTNLQAYRKDKVDGWVTTSGGSIWNYWSWISLRRPEDKPTQLTVLGNSAMKSCASQKLEVTLKDAANNPVAGAVVNVDITVSPNASHVPTLTPSQGSTNANGLATFTLKAPCLLEEDPPDTLTLTVTAVPPSPLVSPNAVEFPVLVFPPGTKFLSVEARLPLADVAPSGKSLLLSAKVFDQDGSLSSANLSFAMTDKSVATSPDLEMPDAFPTTTGLVDVVLGAPNVAEDTTYTIRINAERAGYHAGSVRQSIVVLVEQTEPGFTAFIMPGGADVGWFLVLTALGVVVASLAWRSVVPMVRMKREEP